MSSLLTSPMVQYGALGLAFTLVLAFIKAFFTLMAQRQSLQESLLNHHGERERAFTEQFMACIDRNSAALEKVEHGLLRIQIQLAQSEGKSADTILVPY
jgi:hypothetical protein